MSFRALEFWRSHLAMLLLGLMAVPAAYGQAPNSPIAFVGSSAITTSFVMPQNVGGSGESTPGDKDQWLKVEFHYGTTPLLKTDFLDEVEFKVWIEGFDPLALNSAGGKGVSVAFTGSVTYINVPAGKDIYGVVYVHPSTLARYCKRSYTDFDRPFNVHIDANVGGSRMAWYDKNRETDPNWFRPLKPITGLVYRQDQSPFLLTDITRYPQLKLLNPGQ